jgi:hypothetical protein
MKEIYTSETSATMVTSTWCKNPEKEKSAEKYPHDAAKKEE